VTLMSVALLATGWFLYGMVTADGMDALGWFYAAVPTALLGMIFGWKAWGEARKRPR